MSRSELELKTLEFGAQELARAIHRKDEGAAVQGLVLLILELEMRGMLASVSSQLQEKILDEPSYEFKVYFGPFVGR